MYAYQAFSLQVVSRPVLYFLPDTRVPAPKHADSSISEIDVTFAALTSLIVHYSCFLSRFVVNNKPQKHVERKRRWALTSNGPHYGGLRMNNGAALICKVRMVTSVACSSKFKPYIEHRVSINSISNTLQLNKS